MEKVIYFEELRFLVVGSIHQYRVEYKIYDVSYVEEDGTAMMPRKDTEYINDFVSDYNEAEVYISGQVKWDGCSDWHFDELDRCMLHGCTKADIERFGLILGECWDLTSELLDTWLG